MFLAYVVVTVLTIVANAAIVVADLRRAPFVLANMAEVGVPDPMLPLLAGLKAAGAAGLALGLAGVPLIGVAAAIGLVLFYAGALLAHVRARVFYNLAFPAAFWLLAFGSLWLALGR